MTEPSHDPTSRSRVALETTLLVHGVPSDAARPLAERLEAIVRKEGAIPATVGVVAGNPVVGLDADQLGVLLDADHVEKANTANLGVLMHRKQHAATTVSTTMEFAVGAGVRVFATGGIGGVHKGYGAHWDVSADLIALTRFPIAVVASGVKNLLDVVSTREMLETLGVPVVGYRTDSFPAFYQRASDAGVDARFDEPEPLAAFVAAELDRTGRGVLICNAIPEKDELDPIQWSDWLADASEWAERQGATGRGVTPAVLGRLHEVSGGATLRANLALVESNCRLAAQVAARMPA